MFEKSASTRLLCAIALLAAAGARAATPAPIPVVNAESEVRQPFQGHVAFFQGNGNSFPVSGTIAVPAGKTLVIQSYSAYAYAAGSSHVMLELQVVSGGITVNHYAGAMAPGAGSGVFIQPLTGASLHADPGSAITVTVVRDVPPASSIGYYDDITVSGYLVNTP